MNQAQSYLFLYIVLAPLFSMILAAGASSGVCSDLIALCAAIRPVCVCVCVCEWVEE